MPLDGSIKSRVRTANRLTALKVAKVKVPGLYEDGAGLRLVVTSVGTKRWVLRLTINGRRVERGLGVWPDVSLDDARRKSMPLRQAAKDGFDICEPSRHGTLDGFDEFHARFQRAAQYVVLNAAVLY